MNLSNDKISLGEHIFETIVAVSNDEQSKGLMWKAWPPPVMCFPSSPSVRKFWMKNTISPLDIVFAHNDIITSIEYGEPLSTRSVGPNQLTSLVIELPAGTCKKLGIKVGQPVKSVFSVKTVARCVMKR